MNLSYLNYTKFTYEKFVEKVAQFFEINR